MAIDDRIYDPQPAPDHRFKLYSAINAYIAPYSSDSQGGNLLTEFNQRAALNTLLKKTIEMQDYADLVASAVDSAFGKEVEIDSTTGQTAMQGPGLYSFKEGLLHDKENWVVTSYATGARDVDEFALSVVDEKLTISAGAALVYGYYIEAATEVKIDLVDVISRAEVEEVQDNPGQNPSSPCRTKFVKLAIQYTTSVNQRHDERLVPPVGGVYPCAVIVINEELPYGNELLLGTITRNDMGSTVVTNSPYKTRLVPLDTIQGAEGYAELIKAVDSDHIYGIKFGEKDGSTDGEVTNLKDINPWLWIHGGSHLATLLRSMSTQAQTSGDAYDEPTRGIIVSDITPYAVGTPVVDEFNCLQKINATTGNSFASVTWHQAQAPGDAVGDVIDYRALYMPYASYASSPLTRELRSPDSDASVKKPFYDLTTYPVLNGLSGTDGLMTYQQLAMLDLVFNDYIHRQESGMTSGRMYGPFMTLEDASVWFRENKPVIHKGDYFWVINDVLESASNESSSLTPVTTNWGSVSGTVTGTAKQTNLTVNVTGTVTGTAHEEGESTDIPVSGDVTGVGKGTINATVSGTVTGTFNSFSQNVSGRYVCIFEGAAGSAATWKFAHSVEYTPTSGGGEPIDDYTIKDAVGTYYVISPAYSEGDTKQDVLFALESVERGFAVPATPDVYGLVKIGTGSELYDVLLDANTNRLRVSDKLFKLVQNGGFANWEGNPTLIPIAPGANLRQYAYYKFPNGVTFKMSGEAADWRAALETTGTLAHVRGDITLDFSEVQEHGKYSDGLLLKLEDIDTLTLKGNNLDQGDVHTSTASCLFGVSHCKINSPFFTNIGSWEHSEFSSGSNTLELDLPWMQLNNVFTKTGVTNSLACKFASVTMGAKGISSAQMDIWIKHAGWEDFKSNIDRMWESVGYINFPPMFFEYEEVDSVIDTIYGEETTEVTEKITQISPKTIQYVPEYLNMKISGTSGVHQARNDDKSDYVPNGNLLVNLNWEYNGNPSTAKTRGGKVYLNLYMKNPSTDAVAQNFTNLRFRAPVQVIRLDDNSMSNIVSYDEIYGSVPEDLT